MNHPFFSVITPSLQRESLVRCCESVNSQTFGEWQHVIQIDSPDLNVELVNKIDHPSREIYCCGKRHGHFGNRCRHIAWEVVVGDYIIFLDDDNVLAHPSALQEVHDLLKWKKFPDFAIFPIIRHGSYFFNDPPGLCQTDTLNICVKREFGRWPDIEAREADGHFVEKLKSEHEYVAFANANPIGIMEYSSNGE